MTPRQSAQETRGSALGNNKPAAGGAVTPSAAGNNRGIGTVDLVLYVLLAGAVVTGVVILQRMIASHAEFHYQRGLAEKQLEWDKDKERAAEVQRRKERAVADALLAEEKRRLAAETAAADANQRWEEARREARNRKPMVVCPPVDVERGRAGRPVAGTAGASDPAAPVAGDPAGDSGGGPRLTWDFVLLYDAAWTGADGQPVFGAAAGGAEAARAGAASPYTPDDALDVHGANARRCSEDRRTLAELIGKIERAAEAWDQERR